MEMLREQLNEANSKNEEYENNKHMLQDNLKKAFLRGMSAMNLEAMGVLGDQDSANISEANNMSHMNMSRTGMSQSELNMTQNRNLSHSMINNMMTNGERLNNTSANTSVLMGKVKTESKEHRWKEAPMMGVEQNEECEEPRPILVKPSTEGKVIKVVDGKSSTVDARKKPISANHIPTHEPSNKSHLVSSRKKL
jgi:hypothetical protein